MDLKKCVFCGEDISIDLRRCPYCGSLLKLDIVQNETGTTEKDNEYTVYPRDQVADVAQMCLTQADDGSIEITECEQKNSNEMQTKESEIINDNASSSNIGYQHICRANSKNSLSNALKVFLTVFCTFIPGLGQLIGVIISVIFINSEEKDKNSFGVVLMVTSLIFFVLSILLVLVHLIALSALK